MVVVLSAASAMVAPAQTLTTIHNFAGKPNDGSIPYAKLVRGTDGNFYGTTHRGGANDDGTVFKMTPSGTVTRLHSFTAQGDGTEPAAGLIQAKDGNFYGTTNGDTSGSCSAGNCGTVFKITAGGTLTTLHTFRPGQGDGGYPQDALVQASDGNFYGTTYSGGTASCGCGTVFKITSSGTVTILHSFTGGSEGEQPTAGLVQATDGKLYGTTQYGGSSGRGTVFKITTSGTLTTLHSFSGPDGRNPQGGLVQAADGNFYGTTNGGGTNSNGTAFKITSGGTLTTLHSFDGADGNLPSTGVIQGADGNFYGATYNGGANSEGTIFKMTSTGTLTTLHSFAGSDGANPDAGLMQTADGSFYGTTTDGGSNGDGTVFKLQFVYYTLTVTTSGDGTVTSNDGFINCPSTCSHSYLANTQVTLNAMPAPGWAFSGWSGGGCSGTGSCQVTMTQNTTVDATFTQLPVTLTVSVAGDGTVKSTDGFIDCPGTCQHTYDPNTQVTLNATPASGWSFSGWTGACMGVGPCNITMTQNFSLTGVFVQPGAGIQLIPVTPCRLVDTRQGQPIQGNSSQSFTLPGLNGCGIPASAAAYSLNVTVIPQKKLGYLTIWPTGEAQPTVSLMNSPDGRVKANAAIVPAGTQGAVSVFVTDTSDVLLDINGYFATHSAGTYQFYPLTPCRIIDTRSGNGGTLQKGEERDYLMAGQCSIPSNATAYSFNITALPTKGELDYLTVWPQGENRPGVSTLNDPTGTVVANAAIVPAGMNKMTAFYANDNPTDLLVDVNGYFAPAGTGGYSFYAVAPCRVLDTRSNNGKPFMDKKVVPVEGSACAPPSNAHAYVFNATVVPPSEMPYLTLWPDTEDQPNVSTLNADDGLVTSNMAIVPNKNGSIDAYAAALTHLLLDISGYFAP